MKYFNKKLGILFITLFIILSLTTVITANQLKVNYIDIGQGDSILIETPEDYTMLIDGGPKSNANKLTSYLNSKDIEKLDYIVSTHPHADHIGGLLTVLNDFEVDKVIDSGKVHTSKTYEDYLTLIDEKNIPYEVGRTGDKFSLGEAEFTVLHPSNTNYGLNNSSIVLLMKYDKAKFIFMGDAEEKTEKEILKNNNSVYAHFLKVGHHGSNSSTTTQFLEEVSPQVAIIMCGSDNSYGHPHNETIERLENNEVSIYRTDKNGTIVVRSDGESFSIKAQYKDRITNEDYEKETKKEEPDNNTKKFVGSIDSDKYHYPSCRWAKKIKAENEIWFSSVAKAKSSGYKPCGTCKPPSN